MFITGLALWSNWSSYYLQYWHPVWNPVVFWLLHFWSNCDSCAWESNRTRSVCLGPSVHMGDQDGVPDSWHSHTSPGHFDHLGSESVGGRSFSLLISLSPTLSPCLCLWLCLSNKSIVKNISHCIFWYYEWFMISDCETFSFSWWIIFLPFRLDYNIRKTS